MNDITKDPALLPKAAATPEEVRAAWVAALRSGEYKQAIGCLVEFQDWNPRYCCLGVLCDLAEQAGVVQRHVDQRGEASFSGHSHTLPQVVADWAGLVGPEGSLVKDAGWESEDAEATLAWLNDNKRYTFAQIADVIESGKVMTR